jgi:cation diffusion facilitator CzcD-associated flavoprotein CzcO
MIKNIIIGAGPAGLAIAGRLVNEGEAFEIIEKTNQIASKWHAHYDRLALHTVKDLSHLPHLPFPADYPVYVPKDKLVAYYENYAAHFKIKPRFGVGLEKINKIKNGWQLTLDNGEILEAENVIVCTGLNKTPKLANWEGQENFKGDISHASLYKNAEPFLGKKTIVVGMGNTGAEIALDLALAGVSVSISVRSPIIVVPRDFFGSPVQLTAKKLEKLPFGLGDWIGAQTRKLVFGNLAKYNVPVSDEYPAKMLRETGKSPTIDLGTIDQIKKGNIKVLGDIKALHAGGAYLVNGDFVEVDKIILATGYTSDLQKQIDLPTSAWDKFGLPTPATAYGEHKGLYFLGYDNYKLGGLLGTIFTDSALIFNKIKPH